MAVEKIKFLHTGDLHLGASFVHSKLPQGIGKIRRQELWSTFNSIVDIAREERVDILLIAGDLFEHNYCSTADIVRINSRLSELEGVMVFIAPGNHDPAIEDSLYNTFRWSPNVYVFRDANISPVRIDRLGVTVWGMGWNCGEIRDDLLSGFECTGTGRHLLLMHCDVVDNGRGSAYLPVRPEQLAACGVDYAALGHIHRGGRIIHDGKVVGQYCGSPEPLDFGEQGEHGVYLGTISGDSVSCRFIPTAKRRFITGRIQISPDTTPEKIIERITLEAEEQGKDNLYRYKLEGCTESSARLDLGYIEGQVPAFYLSLEDNTSPGYDYQSIIENDSSGITGIFTSKLMARLENEEDPTARKILERALHIGLEALNGRRVIGR
jgi:exonuclease SbcD